MMYKVTLINSVTNLPHEVLGRPICVVTDNLKPVVEQLMRNRDSKLFRVSVEEV